MKKPERKTKLEELVDELAEEGLPKHLRIAYYLYDLSRDMVRFANEVRDAGEVDANELARLVRRALAAFVAAHAETEVGVREILANPHRLKGEECP
ncbi:hypothetical protein [Thermus tengchongensis]|uniref:Uncharacterized protein n=2 Tax=Thermus TaxID=270 RepID=A0A4Y9FC44_9DEIN|nr:hypothetical protein [Thermus tengchongensis]TFU26170.1 hypothetical protein E0687_07200 [Thermus tengchongensis]